MTTEKNLCENDSQDREKICCGECSKEEGETPSFPATESEEYKDKYLRLLAENENLRRRLQKEGQDLVKFAIQKLLVEFLEPYDSFEKALFHAGFSASEEVRQWATGFKMIHQQFKDWLGSQGVHSFLAKGEPFSSHLHEAVELVRTNQFPEGYILEELSKGYKIHDRVLRVAKVTIAKALEPLEELISQAETDIASDEFGSSQENL